MGEREDIAERTRLEQLEGRRMIARPFKYLPHYNLQHEYELGIKHNNFFVAAQALREIMWRQAEKTAVDIWMPTVIPPKVADFLMEIVGEEEIDS